MKKSLALVAGVAMLTLAAVTVRTLAAGDSVTVFAGRYAGFQITTSGTATKRITFTGQAGSIIDTR